MEKESQPSSKLVLASAGFIRTRTNFSIKLNYESYLKIFARSKSKNYSAVVELVTHLRWVIIYALLVVKREMYIYSGIYIIFLLRG